MWFASCNGAKTKKWSLQHGYTAFNYFSPRSSLFQFLTFCFGALPSTIIQQDIVMVISGHATDWKIVDFVALYFFNSIQRRNKTYCIVPDFYYNVQLLCAVHKFETQHKAIRIQDKKTKIESVLIFKAFFILLHYNFLIFFWKRCMKNYSTSSLHAHF